MNTWLPCGAGTSRRAGLASTPARLRGASMLVVLVLLSVMLLGGLSFARISEIGVLAGGNAAYREASLQASEIGLNTAFAAVLALPSEEADRGGWYFALARDPDADGLPTLDWTATPEIVVGALSVRYAVERVCQGALPVTDPLRQCLVTQVSQVSSADVSRERPDPPNAKQFRVTVRVNGPKGTRTWVQSLITRG